MPWLQGAAVNFALNMRVEIDVRKERLPVVAGVIELERDMLCLLIGLE
jgi:hypothetical protein